MAGHERQGGDHKSSQEVKREWDEIDRTVEAEEQGGPMPAEREVKPDAEKAPHHGPPANPSDDERT
jgi:hypothetical protein